ncbi:MAG: phage major capsid protein [Pseudomonadota bacterium]
MSKFDVNDARQARSAAAQAMQETADELAELEGAETPDADTIAAVLTRHDQATADFERLDRQIARHEAAERAAATAAVPAPSVPVPSAPGGPAPGAVPAVAVHADDKLVPSALMMGALAATRGVRAEAVKVLEAAGHSEISASLELATPAAGGFLQPEGWTGNMIEALRARTVMRRAGCDIADMPAGRIKDMVTGSEPVATYRAEGAAITVSEPTFDNRDLDFKSLATILSVTYEALEFTSTSLMRRLGNMQVNAIGQREDIAFIRGDGSANTPIGLLNWVTAGNTIAANATVNAGTVELDLLRCKGALDRANLASMLQTGWIMHPDTKTFLSSLRDANGNRLYASIDGGVLLDWPVYTTTNIPNNLGGGADETEIYACVFPEMTIGDAGRIIMATSDAAVVGGESMFQNHKVAMKMVAQHDFAPMHDVAIAVITGAAWTLG